MVYWADALKERTKQFALRIVRLFRALPREVPTTMRTRVPKHPLPLFILIFVFGIVGCRIPTEPPPPLLHLLAESQARWSRSEAIGEFVKAGMQPKADPCNDFYQYACGGWSENSVAQQVGLEGAIGLSQVRAWKLLDDMVRSQSDDDRQAGMRKFYASCADGEAIERRGIAPLKTWLGEMDGPASMESFMATLGRLHRWGIPALFTLDVVPDAGGAARYTVEMRQGGLGLYAPEQYLNDSREASSTR
jgi:predicted metalloendopeptidase